MSYPTYRLFNLRAWLAFFVGVSVLFSCKNTTSSPPKDDGHNVYYEIYAPYWAESHALNEITSHAERFRNMAVDAVIISPLQPISDVMKIGELGSPFAIADFDRLDSTLGTEDELKNLVQTLHDFHIDVYMDWFPTLCGRDNPLKKYAFSAGADSLCYNPYHFPYSDVLALDYSQDGLEETMLNSICKWIEKYNFDGLRIFHDPLIPESFYEKLASRCDIEIIRTGAPFKEYIPLASQNDVLCTVALQCVKGEIPTRDFLDLVRSQMGHQKENRINYVTSYLTEGRSALRISPRSQAYKMLMAFNTFFSGSPLLLSGVEIPYVGNRNMHHRMITHWPEKMQDDFYRTLFLRARGNRAFHNHQATEERLIASNNPNVLIMEKKNGQHIAVGVFNLTNESQEFQPEEDIFNLNDYATQRAVFIHKDQKVKLAQYQFILLTNA